MRTETEIMAVLSQILEDFQGREYSGPLTRQTMFFADLGLASIDAVVLGETLQERFQQSIPFNKFLAQVSQRHVQDLAVGELVDFLRTHIN